MENKKNNKVFIIFSIIIIIAASAVFVLFTKGIIGFKPNNEELINDEVSVDLSIDNVIVSKDAPTSKILVDGTIDVSYDSTKYVGVALSGYCVGMDDEKYLIHGPGNGGSLFKDDGSNKLTLTEIIPQNVEYPAGTVKDLSEINWENVKIKYCKVDKASLISSQGEISFEKELSDEKKFDTSIGNNGDDDNAGSQEKTLSQLATTSTELGVTSVNTCATSGICNPGTDFAIKVNEKETYKFYVMNDSGDRVTLIMDRNLGDNVFWITKDDYVDSCEYYDVCADKGPITALKYLQSQTSTWTNLESLSVETFEVYKSEDDSTVEKNLSQSFAMYARLPKYSEISEFVIDDSNNLPTWLYINLYGTGDNTADSTGNYKESYWTATAMLFPPDNSHYVSNSGYLRTFSKVDFSRCYIDGVGSCGLGVRPVIELSK